MVGSGGDAFILNPLVRFFVAAQEMVEKDFSLLIGLSVALTVFLVVSLTSIRILRRKGRSPSMYTMTNLSKPKKSSYDRVVA